jgi:hypothetical protein
VSPLYADGMIYEGEYYAGAMDGKGKIAFSDGAYYRCSFKRNHMNGAGKYYYSSR